MAKQHGGPAAPDVRLPISARYRPIPFLLKPHKRNMRDALPSALHLSAAVTLCVLVFAVIAICVTHAHGPRAPWSKLIQSGTMMAMITALILATPNLGTSVTKAVARILGVFVGGWLFFGLYAANQSWWFLTICLTVWAFLLVALSFWLTNQQFLSPVALVTAFIVACSFNSVKQALVMTAVKTVAISGSIFLYTLLAMLMFPESATQQLLRNLAIALAELQQLADIVLLSGEPTAMPGAASAAAAGDAAAKDLNAPAAAAGAKDAAAGPPAAGASKAGTVAAAAAAAASSASAGLAADIGHRLQVVQDLLPASRKERFAGSCGAYRCFVPAVRNVGLLGEPEVLAVVLNASQVLRVLVTTMSEFGTRSLPMSQRSAPSYMAHGAEASKLIKPLVQHAVASLKDISAAVPITGRASASVSTANIHTYSGLLQQLLSSTVEKQQDAAALQEGIKHAAAAVEARDKAAGADTAAAPPSSTAAQRWRQAAVVAGAQLPQHNKAEQLAAAFGALLRDAATSEEAQTARWCSLLVLARQLGRSIACLSDSVSEMLPQLPWAGQPAAAAARE